MAHRLVYHDLIAVRPTLVHPGIYWLRMYAQDQKRVAVLTEVPGNPGQNVLNASDRLVSEIEQRFSIASPVLSTYLVLPRGSADPDRRLVLRVETAPDQRWPEASIDEIETAVGQRLVALPPHADLLWSVIAAGGDLQDQIEEPVFETILVEDLPPPHAPWKCALAGRFEAMEAELGKVALSDEEEAAIGERFIASLSDDDRASCRYHVGDWRAIAEESVRILGHSLSTDRMDLADAARDSPLLERDRQWLVSLFQDPVIAHARSYGNGQHRGCALRFSGARQAAVVGGFHSRQVEPGVWVYEGDG